jgi:hypothetical protein
MTAQAARLCRHGVWYGVLVARAMRKGVRHVPAPGPQRGVGRVEAALYMTGVTSTVTYTALAGGGTRESTVNPGGAPVALRAQTQARPPRPPARHGGCGGLLVSGGLAGETPPRVW